MGDRQFLQIPTEIRASIYRHLFDGAFVRFDKSYRGDLAVQVGYESAILMTCRQIHDECQRILWASLEIVFGDYAPPDDLRFQSRRINLSRVRSVAKEYSPNDDHIDFDLKAFPALTLLRKSVQTQCWSGFMNSSSRWFGTRSQKSSSPDPWIRS